MTLYKNAYIYFSRDGVGTIPVLRQPKDWVGGSRKWPVFADVQYFIYTVRKSPKLSINHTYMENH